MTDPTPEYGPDDEGCMWRFSDDRWQWYDEANDEWDDADSMDMADLIPVLAAEIERLQAWRAEGLEVLDQWEKVYDLVPHRTADLGRTKASVVADEIERLRTLFRRHRDGHVALDEFCGICWEALSDD